MNASGANGHFFGLLRHPVEDVALGSPNQWLHYQAVTARKDPRIFSGAAQLVPPSGVSVISDIDDTIKISEVTNRRALLANTFVRAFRSVPGMAEAYRAWAAKGLVFHYVSGSPWQLYSELLAFMGKVDLPRGSFHLRPFRLKDRSLLNLVSPPGDFKTPAIESLLKSYPARRFILIGDSGERDPEIYADIARRYPRQVLHIFIRQIAEPPGAPRRYARAFADVPKKQWTLFSDPAALLRFEPEMAVDRFGQHALD